MGTQEECHEQIQFLSKTFYGGCLSKSNSRPTIKILRTTSVGEVSVRWATGEGLANREPNLCLSIPSINTYTYANFDVNFDVYIRCRYYCRYLFHEDTNENKNRDRTRRSKRTRKQKRKGIKRKRKQKRKRKRKWKRKRKRKMKRKRKRKR